MSMPVGECRKCHRFMHILAAGMCVTCYRAAYARECHRCGRFIRIEARDLCWSCHHEEERTDGRGTRVPEFFGTRRHSVIRGNRLTATSLTPEERAALSAVLTTWRQGGMSAGLEPRVAS